MKKIYNQLNLAGFIFYTLQVLLLLPTLTACSEDDIGKREDEGKTLNLTIKATAEAIPETRAVIREATQGSEAEKAGFHYELVSSDADSSSAAIPVTKAPTTLKNVYALLFKSDGTFNGRANIGTMTASTDQVVTFTNVADAAAAGCRLVIVANDNAATNNYASTGGTGGFASFTGNYAAFQALVMTNTINSDADIPYAGSSTVNLFAGGVNATASVQLYRTLAKVTLNNTFSITGGPARSSIALCNAGAKRFATQGNDNYDGTGSTQTTTFVATTAGSNANSNTWYVGENIRPAGSSITSAADRNSTKAPANASYIRITSAAQSIVNTSPAIGEEYIKSGTETFNYDIYLGKSTDIKDFSLRRHTNYTITSTISGTLAAQEQLAANDGRVTLDVSKQAIGLCIGMFGGASGYTTGTGLSNTITGSYTKMLLLAPTSTENSGILWSDNTTTKFQTETRRYWDHTYTLANIETGAAYAYAYCNSLNVNGVTGWYLPTQAQLMAIYGMFPKLKESDTYGEYDTFALNYYWTSTQEPSTGGCYVYFANGFTHYYDPQLTKKWVRCVKDGGQPVMQEPMVTTIDGYPVIDLTSLSPLGCLLTHSEANDRCRTMYTYTPSANTMLATEQSQEGSWNAKMSVRYQIMSEDLKGSEGAKMNWVDAWNGCKAYTGEGGEAGSWRLPTQRELMMIWVLHPQLQGKVSSSKLNYSLYWASTEGNATSAWYLIASTGIADKYYLKTETLYARCVRDI